MANCSAILKPILIVMELDNTSTRLNRARIGCELKETFRLALPLILGQLSAMGMNVVDTLLAGHFNAHALAAVAIGTSVWSLGLVCALGIMMALPPSVAHLRGAGREEHIGRLFRQSLWLALVLGVMLWFLVRRAEPLLNFMRVDPSIVNDSLGFLRAISWGAPALSGYFALRGLSEGLGLTRPTMYFGFLGLLLLAPLGYVLMYGKFGISAYGAIGLGFATSIVLWVQMFALLTYAVLRQHYQTYRLFSHFEWPHWSSIAELLRLGVPMGITLLMEAGLFVTAALMIGSLGETTVASHQVALNAASVAFMVPLGLALAITVRVGHAMGRNDPVAVRYAGFVGIGMTLATQAFSATCMALFPQTIATLYTKDVAVITLASQLLMLAALFQFSDGIQVAANGALRGLKDTRVPMFITLLAYWAVGMPVGYFLAFSSDLGARGIWIGLIIGLTVAALLLFVRFFYLVQHRPIFLTCVSDTNHD